MTENSAGLKARLSKALFELNVKLASCKSGTLVQVWMPEITADGSTVLSAQGLPFAIAGVGDLLALFRCVSCRYRFSTDVTRPALMGAIGRVYSSCEPEMSHNVQKYDKQVYLRVSEAQRCRVHSTLVMPVFDTGDDEASDMSRPVAVFELVQADRHVAFPAVIAELRSCLAEVSLSTSKPESFTASVGLRNWPMHVDSSAFLQELGEDARPQHSLSNSAGKLLLENDEPDYDVAGPSSAAVVVQEQAHAVAAAALGASAKLAGSSGGVGSDCIGFEAAPKFGHQQARPASSLVSAPMQQQGTQPAAAARSGPSTALPIPGNASVDSKLHVSAFAAAAVQPSAGSPASPAVGSLAAAPSGSSAHGSANVTGALAKQEAITGGSAAAEGPNDMVVDHSADEHYDASVRGGRQAAAALAGAKAAAAGGDDDVSCDEAQSKDLAPSGLEQHHQEQQSSVHKDCSSSPMLTSQVLSVLSNAAATIQQQQQQQQPPKSRHQKQRQQQQQQHKPQPLLDLNSLLVSSMQTLLNQHTQALQAMQQQQHQPQSQPQQQPSGIPDSAALSSAISTLIAAADAQAQANTAGGTAGAAAANQPLLAAVQQLQLLQQQLSGSGLNNGAVGAGSAAVSQHQAQLAAVGVPSLQQQVTSADQQLQQQVLNVLQQQQQLPPQQQQQQHLGAMLPAESAQAQQQSSALLLQQQQQLLQAQLQQQLQPQQKKQSVAMRRNGSSVLSFSKQAGADNDNDDDDELIGSDDDDNDGGSGSNRSFSRQYTGGSSGGGSSSRAVGAGRRLTFEDLQAQFGLGLKEAAANLGICATTLKRACRRNGITRWPRRQIQKLNRTLNQMGSQSNGPPLDELVHSAIKKNLKPSALTPAVTASLQQHLLQQAAMSAAGNIGKSSSVAIPRASSSAHLRNSGTASGSYSGATCGGGGLAGSYTGGTGVGLGGSLNDALPNSLQATCGSAGAAPLAGFAGFSFPGADGGQLAASLVTADAQTQLHQLHQLQQQQQLMGGNSMQMLLGSMMSNPPDMQQQQQQALLLQQQRQQALLLQQQRQQQQQNNGLAAALHLASSSSANSQQLPIKFDPQEQQQQFQPQQQQGVLGSVGFVAAATGTSVGLTGMQPGFANLLSSNNMMALPLATSAALPAAQQQHMQGPSSSTVVAAARAASPASTTASPSQAGAHAVAGSNQQVHLQQQQHTAGGHKSGELLSDLDGPGGECFFDLLNDDMLLDDAGALGDITLAGIVDATAAAGAAATAGVHGVQGAFAHAGNNMGASMGGVAVACGGGGVRGTSPEYDAMREFKGFF